jgi:hypothetical protein
MALPLGTNSGSKLGDAAEPLPRSTLRVLDEPADLPVHPGPRGGPSVEDFFPSLSRKDGPWLLRRPDADTAFCLAVALRRTTLKATQAEFAAEQARKDLLGCRPRCTGRPAGQ